MQSITIKITSGSAAARLDGSFDCPDSYYVPTQQRCCFELIIGILVKRDVHVMLCSCSCLLKWRLRIEHVTDNVDYVCAAV